MTAVSRVRLQELVLLGKLEDELAQGYPPPWRGDFHPARDAEWTPPPRRDWSMRNPKLAMKIILKEEDELRRKGNRW